MKLLRGLAMALGVLLVIVGGAAAAVVGPDDTVIVGESDTSTPGFPVVTDPVITAFSGVDLVVEAESDADVFIGAAHRVDVTNMVTDASYVEAYGVRFDAVDLADVRIDQDPATLAAPDSDVWLESASGDGRQRLVVPLTTEPVAIVVAPTTDAAATDADTTTSNASTGGKGADKTPQPVARLAVPLVATALLGTGCALPAVEAVGTPTKQAIDAGELETLGDDLTQRERAAYTKARKRYAYEPWHTAYSEGMAQALVTTTKLARVDDRNLGEMWFNDYHDVLPNPRFGSYPMWTVVTSDAVEPPAKGKDNADNAKKGAKKGNKKEDEADKNEDETGRLSVLTRASATEPWKTAVEVEVDLDSLPAATESPAVDDTAAIERADALADQLLEWWGRAKGPAGITLTEQTKEIRRDFLDRDVNTDHTHTTFGVSRWGFPDQRLRVVEVADGHLAFSTYEIDVYDHFRAGTDYYWNEGYDDLYGRRHDALYRTYVVTTVLHLPASAKPGKNGKDGKGDKPAKAVELASSVRLVES